MRERERENWIGKSQKIISRESFIFELFRNNEIYLYY